VALSFQHKDTLKMGYEATTPKEQKAIRRLTAALRALPRSLYIECQDGQVEFWKRTGPGSANMCAAPLRCKHAVDL
jgi:hypothetical protein